MKHLPLLSCQQALLASILLLLEQHVRTLQGEGFGPLEAAYTDNWLHTGQQVLPDSPSPSADAVAVLPCSPTATALRQTQLQAASACTARSLLFVPDR